MQSVIQLEPIGIVFMCFMSEPFHSRKLPSLLGVTEGCEFAG